MTITDAIIGVLFALIGVMFLCDWIEKVVG